MRAVDQINLNDIAYAADAALCVRGTGHRRHGDKLCLPGTRIAALDHVEQWINTHEPTDRILLLTDLAGSGNSTLARTVAHRFAALERLAASFGFDRNRTERTPDKLFPTIARDMADLDPAIKRALSDAVGDNRALRCTSDIEEQFINLIVRPLESLAADIVGPLVIVIDALDECADVSHASREELMLLLAQRSHELPKNIRLVITSRPDHDIVQQLGGPLVKQMDMRAIDAAASVADV